MFLKKMSRFGGQNLVAVSSGMGLVSMEKVGPRGDMTCWVWPMYLLRPGQTGQVMLVASTVVARNDSMQSVRLYCSFCRDATGGVCS